MCACFQLPRHIGRHTPTSGEKLDLITCLCVLQVPAGGAGGGGGAARPLPPGGGPVPRVRHHPQPGNGLTHNPPHQQVRPHSLPSLLHCPPHQQVCFSMYLFVCFSQCLSVWVLGGPVC